MSTFCNSNTEASLFFTSERIKLPPSDPRNARIESLLQDCRPLLNQYVSRAFILLEADGVSVSYVGASRFDKGDLGGPYCGDCIIAGIAYYQGR